MVKNAEANKKPSLHWAASRVFQSAVFLAEQKSCASSSPLQRSLGIIDHDKFLITRWVEGWAMAGKDCSC